MPERVPVPSVRRAGRLACIVAGLALGGCWFESPPPLVGEPDPILVTELEVVLHERGTDVLGVRLRDRPDGEVVVRATSRDPRLVTVTPATLRFSPADYDVAQDLTLDAPLDDNDTEDQVTIALTADGLAPTSIKVTISDGTPTVPVLRLPLEGSYLGSHLIEGSRRPGFAWEASTVGGPEAITYQLQLSTDPAFVADLTTIATAERGHRPVADLPVATTAPVGARYHWRVRACAGGLCSAPSAPRRVHVGRSARDLDGDGYADVVITDHATRRVLVYRGGPGAALDATPDATLTGPGDGGGFGYGVVVGSAGDVNGDGFADLVVGAPRAHDDDVGHAYVYLGGATLALTVAATLAGEVPDGAFGRSARAAGDVNGDGFADLVVGSDVGRVYVYLGGPGDGFDPTVDGVLQGAAGDEFAGFAASTASAGDVNGDGFADLIIGAQRNDAAGTDAGRAYIYLGGPGDGFDPTVDAVLDGELPEDYFGRAVASAGDVNGDGFADVLVGAPGNDSGGRFAGRAYLFLGGPGPHFDTTADATMTGSFDAELGIAVASAGDVNGDGFADVIVGAWFDADQAGRAEVYLGGPAGVAATAAAVLTGPVAGGRFGYTVAPAGDVNGDGFADVVVGAQVSEGRTRVFFGGPGASFDTAANGALPSGGAGS